MTQRSVWIHVHIPKSGGSTLNSILKRNFGRGFVTNYSLLDNYCYSQKQIEEILNIHKNLTCLADHKASTNLPFDLINVNTYAITTFRDPVDRFLSIYFYTRHQSTDSNPIAKSMNLDEYIQWYLDLKKLPDFNFYQSCRATGLPLNKAVEQIKFLIQEKKLYVLPISRFDEACLILEKKFPQFFKDCSYIQKNVSKKDQKITEEQRQKILDINRSGFQLEYQLLQFVEEKLEVTLKELFASQQEQDLEIKKFRDRCAVSSVVFKGIMTKFSRANYFLKFMQDY